MTIADNTACPFCRLPVLAFMRAARYKDALGHWGCVVDKERDDYKDHMERQERDDHMERQAEREAAEAQIEDYLLMEHMYGPGWDREPDDEEGETHGE